MKNRFRTLPTLVKDGRIPLNFKLSEVKAMAIVGVDLVALMKDGSRLLLPGLDVYKRQQLDPLAGADAVGAAGP